MMNVSEYANDVGKKVSEILKLCQTLDIKVSNEEDMLSDDDIIMLDNEIANMDEEEEVEELEGEIEDFADSYEEELEEITSNDKEEVHKKKNSIKKDIKKNDFRAKRKEMYKHKSLDTEILLKWSKLLEYDFFRIYTQHLILYAPPVKQEENENNKKSSLPQFRKNIYTKEIIDFILEQISNGKMTKNEVIERYRIPKTTLYKWISKYSEIK